MKRASLLTLCALTACLALAGCKDDAPPAEAETPATNGGTNAAGADADKAAEGKEGGDKAEGDKAGDKAAVKDLPEHMAKHYNRATEIRDMIIAGRLEATREPAGWLAEHGGPEGAPEEWQPNIDKMKAHAKAMKEAKDLTTVGLQLGQMGTVCGDCHTANKANPEFKEKTTPPGGDAPKDRMQRHAWGVRRMWEGIYAPSDDQWDLGAVILAEQPLHESDYLKGKKIGPKAEAFSKTVHELGNEAVKATEPSERAEIYGKLLGTCSGCHMELEANDDLKK